MKNLILFFLLLPTSLFSQISERQQKEAVRNFGTYSPSVQQRSSSFERSPSIREFEQKQIERNRRSEYYSPRNNRPGRYFHYDPWLDWGWGGRWNRWGAPMFGFSYWDPWIWNDPWGYRNPARIYVYDDGRRDTVRAKATRLSFGIQISNNRSVGGFLTIGNRGYFIAEYQKTFQNDLSTFYPDLTMDVVIPWKDKRLEDIVSESIVYLGAGKKIKRTGFHLSLGFGREFRRYQFEDEFYVLSNNGSYSLTNYDRNFMSVKAGFIHDFKRISIKGDYDPIRKNAIFGLGLNL
jgi:hypothetical protein